MSGTVTARAHAKVNLFLRVLAREDDGYHSLETLYCLVSLADTLRAERAAAGELTLEVTGADCGPVEDNLAFRAARMVLDATGAQFGVRLTLEKRIPVRAGLGGGSSDAAAALVAVNRLASDAIPRHELLQLAARLGSDVPFLFSGAPLAIGWGRGDRLLRLPALPTAPALLLVPAAGTSTAEAYQRLDQGRKGGGRRGAVALDLEALSSWGSVARLSGNDFEFALFGSRPDLRQAFDALVATHPLLCRLSGSGSALVAVYRSPGDRADAAQMLGTRHGRLLEVETLSAPPGPMAEP